MTSSTATKVPHTGAFVVWDDVDYADQLAVKLGGVAKHSPNRFKADERYWKTFSVVILKKR